MHMRKGEILGKQELASEISYYIECSRHAQCIDYHNKRFSLIG